MKINDDWKLDDLVTGLKFSVIPGKELNRLHIDNIRQEGDLGANRDLWFTKDGKFDGTGSCVSENK